MEREVYLIIAFYRRILSYKISVDDYSNSYRQPDDEWGREQISST